MKLRSTFRLPGARSTIAPGTHAPRLLALLTVLLGLLSTPARAHIGSKDVFEQLSAGPYKLFITIRPPTVVPGVATVEIRALGPQISSIHITPVPLADEASLHPPAPDVLRRSPADPDFYTGSLWLMATGSWQVRIHVTGSGGPADASVPVAAIALSVLRMQRPLGFLLGALGILLVLGMTGVVYAAVREARLAPGQTPGPDRTRRAALAGALTLALLLLAVWAGNNWWNVEAAAYSSNIYKPLRMEARLQGPSLLLHISPFSGGEDGSQDRSNTDLLPDHGHIMHLYAIRWPEMDAAFHLHPSATGDGNLRSQLPAMPPGTYRLFGDIVHRNGFPETLTATLNIPPDAPHVALGSEDAAATPAPLSAGMLGTRYHLPDGYTMVWDRPATFTAGTPELFRFTLLDPQGQPADNIEPYLGMAGHAAFVKTDGTVFAHTHPEGSAAMAALMLANGGQAMPSDGMAGMAPRASTRAPGAQPDTLDPIVEFPYGFPTPGRYRIFIQMKHGNTVETGVFDTNVQ